ncbi:MAG: hydrogenase iron-sulfur subunit [Chloroflexi bacterium]|nr:hydrogenase iron-sulfur subunit [Chloroflexota bacterium]
MDNESMNNETINNERDWEPRIIVFLCDWCLYSELDRADIARVQEQPNVRIVKIPCLGRMDPMHVLMALQEGIDGVLVAGCHLGDCHYKQGNLMAENRIAVLQTVLKAAGVMKGRARFAHISTAERGVLPRLIEEVKEEVKALGPIEQPWMV